MIARQIARPQHWDILQIVEPVVYLGIVNALFAFGLLHFLETAQPPELRTAWYLLLTITGILTLFPVRNRRFLWQDALPSWEVNLAIGAALAARILLAELPLAQRLFGFAALPTTVQIAILGYSLLYLLVAELLLRAYYRHTSVT